MKIAIVGMHGDTQTGFNPEEWEHVYGLAHDLETPIRCTEAFEAHSREIIEAHQPSHVERLRNLASHMPLITAWDWPERLGPYHYTVTYSALSAPVESSPAFMMAHSIAQRPDEIGVYGVDMAEGEEYAYQRPNMAYLIGVAEGRGITVTLHEASRLMRSGWTGGCYGHRDNVDDCAYRLPR